MTQPTLDDPLAAPGGGRSYQRGQSRPAPDTDRARPASGGDPLTLPGAAAPGTRGSEERAAPRTAGERPATEGASAPPAAPAQRAAAPTPAPSQPGRVLLVIEGGQVKYHDDEIMVADLDTLRTSDPDTLYALLKGLREVKGSAGRSTLADRLTSTLRESLAL